MRRETLERQGIASVEYDDTQALLRVHFIKGSVYEYRAVPSGVFEWLVRTPQPSVYLSRMITPSFAYQRVDRPTPPSVEDLESQLEASLERLTQTER